MGDRRIRRLLAATLGVGVILVAGLSHGGGADRVEGPSAEEILDAWKPDLPGGQEFGTTGGSPEKAPDVAAVSFKSVGWSFEQLWNHYADRCGVADRYKEKTFLITTGTGEKGSYVVSDRPAADGGGGRGLSVFLLKADGYTATVTLCPDADGKSVLGSITVAATR